MKKHLAHVKTKAELTECLASKTLEKGRQSGKCVHGSGLELSL